jgi:hypothetical protein
LKIGATAVASSCARISARPNFKLDLAGRPANTDGMKWKANLLFPEFGQADVWPKYC